MEKEDLEFMIRLYLREIILAYALKNAIKNNGVADEKRVLNSVIGHIKKVTNEQLQNWMENRLPTIFNEIENERT